MVHFFKNWIYFSKCCGFQAILLFKESRVQFHIIRISATVTMELFRLNVKNTKILTQTFIILGPDCWL
jgi:hypothetical protein